MDSGSEDVAAHIAAGNRHYLSGELDDAQQRYLAALRLDRNNTTALYGLAEVLYEATRFEEAIRALMRAAQTTQNHTPIGFLLARCFMALGRPEDALSIQKQLPQVYIVEISGSCNLRCPSCPNGNARDLIPGRGRMQRLMDIDVYTRIIDRIAQQPYKAQSVVLYNWGEPLLHPKIGEMVSIAQRAGIPASISTNLNAVKHLEAAVRAQPAHFKVSMSGLTDQTYGLSHAGGVAADMIANMQLLRQLIDRYARGMPVELAFHIYKHNHHEFFAVKALAAELGFNLTPSIAYFCPHERLVEHIETGVTNEADRPILDSLVLDVDTLIAHGKEHGGRLSACAVQLAQTVINADGSLGLCCSIYDAKYNLAPSFLDLDPLEAQRRKLASEFCGTCSRHGLHVSFGGSSTRFIAEERKRLGNQKLAEVAGYTI